MDNWYKIALEEERLRIISQEDLMLKEAGLADIFKSIPIWVITAIMAVGNGMSAEDAKNKVANQYNLNQTQLEKLGIYLNDKVTIDQVLEAVKEQPQIQQPQIQQNIQSLQVQPPKLDLDKFVRHIVNHEGLLPRQTPFRITNHEMKNWNTILGFQVFKGKKPRGRENFIFLKNPQDVEKAVKKQFIEYIVNPTSHGLPSNPTIKNAIQKFDQSGKAKNKLAYLKHNISGFNENAPLSSIL